MLVPKGPAKERLGRARKRRRRRVRLNMEHSQRDAFLGARLEIVNQWCLRESRKIFSGDLLLFFEKNNVFPAGEKYKKGGHQEVNLPAGLFGKIFL